VLALIGNIAPTELLVIAALAVIIFGRRLPEVAARAYGQFRRGRESLERMRRETGIDRELRNIQYSVSEAARAASEEVSEPPSGLRAAQGGDDAAEDSTPDSESADEDETEDSETETAAPAGDTSSSGPADDRADRRESG